jgi:hypothetical protein
MEQWTSDGRHALMCSGSYRPLPLSPLSLLGLPNHMVCLQIIVKTWNNGKPTPEFNNAGQVFNHDFYWESITPKGPSKSPPVPTSSSPKNDLVVLQSNWTDSVRRISFGLVVNQGVLMCCYVARIADDFLWYKPCVACDLAVSKRWRCPVMQCSCLSYTRGENLILEGSSAAGPVWVERCGVGMVEVSFKGIACFSGLHRGAQRGAQGSD